MRAGRISLPNFHLTCFYSAHLHQIPSFSWLTALRRFGGSLEEEHIMYWDFPLFSVIKHTSQSLQLLVSKSIYYLFALLPYQSYTLTSSESRLIVTAHTVNCARLVSRFLSASTQCSLFSTRTYCLPFCDHFAPLHGLLDRCKFLCRSPLSALT